MVKQEYSVYTAHLLAVSDERDMFHLYAANNKMSTQELFILYDL